jgi:MYXO-CTERM domain-containing protein
MTGVAKPEIAAPGAAIVASMSGQAKPGITTSIFTFAGCPIPTGQTTSDGRCKQVDLTHGISVGTSMASPMVTGAVAALLQRDPTLTQDLVRALLQAGAHRFRGPAPYMDQSGPGELDVAGSLAALDELGAPAGLPSVDTSWMTLSSSYLTADGSSSVTALVELRTDDSRKRASLFDLSRLSATVVVAERSFAPQITRVAPGLFTFAFTVPAGLGGARATFSVFFDGDPIVEPVSVPVGSDPWSAGYSSSARGGCAMSSPAPATAFVPLAMLIAIALIARRRR